MSGHSGVCQDMLSRHLQKVIVSSGVCVCVCMCVSAPIIGEGCWLYSIAEDVSPENNSRMATDEMTQPFL